MNRYLITLIAIALIVPGCGTTAAEDQTSADALTKASTGPAVAGDREVGITPQTAYTNMGGDNQQSRTDFTVKRDVNNAAQAPGQQTGFSLNAVGDVRRMLAEDPVLLSIADRMKALGAAAAAATDAAEIERIGKALEAERAAYVQARRDLMQSAEAFGTINMPNLTNLTVANVNMTNAGREAEPLPDSYANAAASIAEKLAQLKGNK